MTRLVPWILVLVWNADCSSIATAQFVLEAPVESTFQQPPIEVFSPERIQQEANTARSSNGERTGANQRYETPHGTPAAIAVPVSPLESNLATLGQEGAVVMSPEVVEQDIPDEKIAHNDPRIKGIDSEKAEIRDFDIRSLLRAPYTIYRREDDSFVYLPGDGDHFGWTSFESSNYLKSGEKYGLTSNMNLHLLSGPNSVPLPPRLYDFELGFQSRRSLSERFSYDCSAIVGVYSDFEDSARDGVRFPAHAVGMFHPSQRADFVFGVDYLGRDDIKILPVFGLCWRDSDRPSLRYEMIFPRPRVDLALSKHTRLYTAGLLGGGTWDIEYPNEGNDVMTYRDYRIVIGIEQADSKGDLSAWELGWVFGRSLEFRSRANERDFDDAFVIRFVSQH